MKNHFKTFIILRKKTESGTLVFITGDTKFEHKSELKTKKI